MIDLRNTCVLVRTQEENEMLLKEAEKQRFHWYGHYDCQPLKAQYFPDILKFYDNNEVALNAFISSNSAFYEASELLGTKEMTAREFVNRIVDIRCCKNRECSKCVLNMSNTKCKKILCDVGNWKENIDEIIEIAKSGKFTVPTPEEKAIDTLEEFINDPDRVLINEEFVESLKLAVEKLKEEV